MNHKILAPALLLGGALLLASCTAAPEEAPAVIEPTQTAAAVQPEPEPDVPLESLSTSVFSPAAVMANNADYTVVNLHEWSETDAITVDLAQPAGDGVESRSGVVTITKAGVYRLSGSLSGGVVVAAPEDAQVVLMLDGVNITNTAGAAIDVQSADDVAIHLTPGSDNTVSDAASYADTAEANAAIYSAEDLTISGSGSLTVHANGNDGITSKDDLVVLDGTITVTAADDALRGKDSLVIKGGTLYLTATGGDGLKSDGDEGDTEIDWTRGYIFVTGGTINITADDDGVQAFTDTIIAGGTVSVSAGDDGVKAEAIVSIGELVGVDEPSVTVTSSIEGIEAAFIGISAGVTSVTASDDGVNASGNEELQAMINGTEYVDDGSGEFMDTGELLEISGGTLTVNAEGDGLDSNGSLTISGGTVVVHGPTMGGNGSLDADGAVTVTGGTITSFGPGSMEQTPNAGEQGWVLISAWLSAGQSGTIVDAGGTVVGEFTTAKSASTVIFSSPSIANGQSYSVVVDGQTLGTATAGEGGFGGPGGMGGGPRW